jgi:hypothetical protein
MKDKPPPTYIEDLPAKPPKKWNRNDPGNMTEKGKEARAKRAAEHNAENTQRFTGTKGLTGGGIKQEVRDILLMGVREAAPLHVKVAKMENIELEHDTITPTIQEAQKAFEICAKHALPPLQTVVEERMMEDLADVLADCPKLTIGDIEDIKDKLIAKWKAASSV